MLLSTAPEGSAQAPRIAPLPVREVVGALSFGSFSAVQLSPDGALVTYTLIDARRVAPELDLRFSSIHRSGVSSSGMGGDVWVAEVGTGAARNVTGGIGNNWSSVWSPDGRLLAFLSDRGGTAAVWVWERATGRLRQIAPAVVRAEGGFDWPLWTSDSRRIVVKLLAEGLTIEQAAMLSGGHAPADGGPAVVVHRSVAAAREFGAATPGDTAAGHSVGVRTSVTQLAVIDVATGQVRRITRGVGVWRYVVAPDGRAVAYCVAKPSQTARSQQFVVDVVVAPLDSGDAVVVAHDVPFDVNVAALSWSPDGARLAYPVTGAWVADPYLGIVARDGTGTRRFAVGSAAGNGDATKRSGHPDEVPLWSADGDIVILTVGDTLWKIQPNTGGISTFSPRRPVRGVVRGQAATTYESQNSGGTVMLVTRDSASQGEQVVALNMTTGSIATLAEGLAHYGGYSLLSGLDRSHDGRRVAFVREDAAHAPDVWVADGDFRSAARVTHVNPVFDQYAMGTARLIAWPGPNGATSYGALLLPPTHRDGERHPLVIDVYGGSFASARINAFGLGVGVPTENMQILATRGIAVLKPDLPLGPGHPMRDIAAGIEAAARRAVALGYADSTRIGVMGQSYGGYSTLAAIISTPTYAAAITRAGVANMTSMYGSLDDYGRNFGLGWAEEGQGRMAGTLWEQRDRYVANSPVFFLDRVRTPVLIIHGTADQTTPPSETAQTFVALRRLGKVVEYARYPGEGHWEGEWSAPSQVDYWERVLRWFETYLER